MKIEKFGTIKINEVNGDIFVVFSDFEYDTGGEAFSLEQVTLETMDIICHRIKEQIKKKEGLTLASNLVFFTEKPHD